MKRPMTIGPGGKHVKNGQSDTWVGKAPKVRFALLDAECWHQVESWNGGIPHNHRHEVSIVDTRPPVECCSCGSGDLVFNGRQWWCEDCDAECLPDVTVAYTWEDIGCEAAVTFGVAKPDPWYEQQTALYRDAASMNWPFGRIRTKINQLNEGKPGR